MDLQDALITTVFKQVPPEHRLRTSKPTPIMTDPASGQLLMYLSTSYFRASSTLYKYNIYFLAGGQTNPAQDAPNPPKMLRVEVEVS